MKATPPTPVFTPARVAIINRDWPTMRPSSDILAEINALPADRLATLRTLQARATQFGLRRPPDAGKRHDLPVAEIAWTPEREDMLRAMFAMHQTDEVVAAVNAMPGRAVTKEAVLTRARKALGLRKSKLADNRRNRQPEPAQPPRSYAPREIKPAAPMQRRFTAVVIDRACLCCRKPFEAQGRFLRLCPSCRASYCEAVA